MRFKLSTVFVAFAITGVCLAAAVSGSVYGLQVIRLIWHWLFAIACFSAYYRAREKRAFWLGVVFTFALWSTPSDWILSMYNPDRPSISTSISTALVGASERYIDAYGASRTRGNSRLHSGVSNSVSLALAVVTSVITGYISATIYKRAKGEPDG